MTTGNANRKMTYSSLLSGILSVLLCMTLISFWMLGNLYAKYVTQANGSDDARVARFAIRDSNNLKETYVLNPVMAAGQEQTIEIRVENSSEVAVRYTFSFETEGNLPLKITAQAPTGIAMDKDVDANRWIVDKAAGNSWDETYDFGLSLEDTEESYQYAGGVERIQLTVKAEQID